MQAFVGTLSYLFFGNKEHLYGLPVNEGTCRQHKLRPKALFFNGYDYVIAESVEHAQSFIDKLGISYLEVEPPKWEVIPFFLGREHNTLAMFNDSPSEGDAPDIIVDTVQNWIHNNPYGHLGSVDY